MYSANQHIAPKEHRVQVATNACYDMLYDQVRNRLYYTIHGFWKNKECVPDFIPDWHKAIAMVKPGFTVLTDMRSMITHPQEMGALHEQAHKIIHDAGAGKVAHVMPSDKIAYLQVLAMQEKALLPAKSFNSYDEAEQWLNFIGTTSAN